MRRMHSVAVRSNAMQRVRTPTCDHLGARDVWSQWSDLGMMRACVQWRWGTCFSGRMRGGVGGHMKACSSRVSLARVSEGTCSIIIIAQAIGGSAGGGDRRGLRGREV